MQATERIYEFQDWITIIFLACLVLLVLAKLLFPQRFEEFISLLNSGKFIAFKGKENKAFHPFNILLLLIQALAVSVFLYIAYTYFFNISDPDLIIYIRIFTAYFCLILIKAGVEKIIGNIFDLDEKIDYYLFQKFSYRNFISLFLLSVSLLLIYTINPTALLIGLVGVSAIIANTIALIIIFKKNQNVLSANWFYFILYLCALEIAPYIILYKLITN
ncbi:DUF4271 domain-containing protein [Christiangramia forsetii]|uniref:Membrane protein n=2 Tax=Christiangramia forsetii TaxID=411153 RepID=A0LXK1_CHRFK|nr:DUF4271 domain-containing protein [Christiangramia forsetii]GGG36627.1 DUF4271 domain-containing protein [Christiangramia forsetii]CAL65096.1 membrane protein [Christiangramia forsetii KT0803]